MRRLRIAHRGPVPWTLAVFLTLAGCARGTEDADPDRAGSASGESASIASAGPGADLVWDPVEGAERYRVRAWSEHRLLFDVVAWENRVASTPVIERVLALHPGAILRIEAIHPNGDRLGEIVEVDVAHCRER